MAITYLSSSSILTAEGTYRFTEISVCELTQSLDVGFVSCIGHDSTAEWLTEVLQRKVKKNRIAIEQNPGDIVLIVKLLDRLDEGKLLQLDELRSREFLCYRLERLE